jgi:hypothetical protein
MNKKLSMVVLVLFVLAFSVLGDAIIPDSTCISNADCITYGTNAFCVLEEFTCYLPTAPQIDTTANATTTGTTNTTTTPTTPPTLPQEVIVDLQLTTQISTLESKVQTLEKELATMQATTGATKAQIDQITVELQGVKFQQSQLKTDIQQGFNTVSTGMASLQDNLNTTSSELDTFEEQLNKNKTLVWVIIFIFIILGSAVGFIFYMNQKRDKQVHPSVLNYITKHIAAGFKFPNIKKNLLRAGWSDEEVTHAYKETMKHNYSKYKGTKPSVGPDKKKIFMIAGFGLIAILLVLFLIRGTSAGQAYFYYGGVEEYEQDRPISTTPTCYPPKIMKDNKCCLDLNANEICDEEEGYVEEGAGVECSQNSECTSGRMCIDGSCKFLFEVYDTSNCYSKCNVRRVKLTAKHEALNLAENYILPRGRGSYTGAGAIEWILLEGPDYCLIKPEEVTIPIKIIKKFESEILSEEVISLKPGQKSKFITHPSVNLFDFTLTVEEVFHTCGEAVILG